MEKNKLKNVTQPAKGKSKIPLGATQIIGPSIDYDNVNPVFSFRHACQNNCLLSSWQTTELDQLVKRLKYIEQMTWKEVKANKGLNYKPVENYVLTLPSSVPKDSVIRELKVDDTKRLFGFRDGNIFFFIWFDREHEVEPMNKSKAKR